MILPAPPDVAFNLFGMLPVYWYGIVMAFAIFISMIVGNSLFNIINPNLKKDVIIEYAPFIILSGILCARLYFCSLNPSYYFVHPIEILDIRQGGLSIHGAIIGGVLSLIFIAKKVNVPLMSIMDAMACTTILGQAVGRWGNYFNSEAYGLPVQGQTWGLFVPELKRVSMYADYTLFHPAFLYESILDLLVFIILVIVYFKLGKRLRGFVFFAYLTFYAVIRFFIEQIRVDSALNIGILPVAEIVSAGLFVIGIIGMLVLIAKEYKCGK